MNNIELYKNKKFDVLNIISMVFKRKQWGKIHTLYSTPTHDVLAVMTNYDFENQYATFNIKVNEKNGTGYYSNDVHIYTNRDDYTPDFINKYLLKSIITTLRHYRENIFRLEAEEIYPYVWRYSETDDYWIKKFGLENKVENIKSTNMSDEEKEELIGLLIDDKFPLYDEQVTYKPRQEYVEISMMSNKEPQILELIEEVKKDLEEVDK